MYQTIKKKKSVAEIYANKLVENEILNKQQIDFIKDTVWSDLEKNSKKLKIIN